MKNNNILPFQRRAVPAVDPVDQALSELARQLERVAVEAGGMRRYGLRATALVLTQGIAFIESVDALTRHGADSGRQA